MTKREKRNEQFKKLIKAFADSVEVETIYHYTSAARLRGIVESSEMWLTNTSFTNDTTECRALQKERNLFSDHDFSNEYVKNAWSTFIKRQDTDNCYYIVSFSKDGNSLSQFRAYGNLCIGFEAERLVKSTFNLYQCVYDKQQIKKWILKKEKVNEWEGDCLDKQAKRMAADALFHSARVKYKNFHYKTEEEIRLFAVSYHTWEPYPHSPSMFEKDPPIHFREHRSFRIPVPYVKFFLTNESQQENRWQQGRETERQMKQRKLEEEKNMKRELLPIKEIRIGPMAHQEETRIACEILLREKGYENVNVNVSDIPYRGF